MPVKDRKVVATRILKFGSFDYRCRMEHPLNPDETIWGLRTAGHQEVIELESESDLERGERLGAFFTQEELDEREGRGAPSDTQEFHGRDYEDMTPEQLAQWIREEQPTVNDVMEVANSSPDMAERLLEAENQATGGDPRKTLVDGLEAVVKAREE